MSGSSGSRSELILFLLNSSVVPPRSSQKVPRQFVYLYVVVYGVVRRAKLSSNKGDLSLHRSPELYLLIAR